ncbi:MAG: ankyrin repeat domain-containing protein [Candidatus Dependentiae bacterium]|nr:ankyrin repeat domain-containing protein [Candidatus Dependentiae bacterium]
MNKQLILTTTLVTLLFVCIPIQAMQNTFQSQEDKRLLLAIKRNDIEGVKKAIARGAQVNAVTKDIGATLSFDAVGVVFGSGQTALMRAIFCSHNENGNTALHKAALYANAATVQALVALGADVDVQNENGNTALMKSADWFKVANVKALVSLGADVDLCDENGYTALMKVSDIYSCTQGDMESGMVDSCMLAHFMKIQKSDIFRKDGCPGVDRVLSAMVQTLFDAGASVDQKLIKCPAKYPFITTMIKQEFFAMRQQEMIARALWHTLQVDKSGKLVLDGSGKSIPGTPLANLGGASSGHRQILSKIIVGYAESLEEALVLKIAIEEPGFFTRWFGSGEKKDTTISLKDINANQAAKKKAFLDRLKQKAASTAATELRSNSSSSMGLGHVESSSSVCLGCQNEHSAAAAAGNPHTCGK